MGGHANGSFLPRKTVRVGCYWLIMESDCVKHVQMFHKCQVYLDRKNAPHQYLHTLATPRPSSASGHCSIALLAWLCMFTPHSSHSLSLIRNYCCLKFFFFLKKKKKKKKILFFSIFKKKKIENLKIFHKKSEHFRNCLVYYISSQGLVRVKNLTYFFVHLVNF